MIEGDGELMEKEIADEIDEAFLFAQASPFPRGEEVEKYLFRG